MTAAVKLQFPTSHSTGSSSPSPHKLPFAPVPNWIMRRPELSQGSKLCYGRLAQYAGKDNECFPKLATLGKELGVSESQVKCYITELKQYNLVQVTRRGLGMSNTYTLTDHIWMHGETVSNLSGKTVSNLSLPLDEDKTPKDNNNTSALSPGEFICDDPDKVISYSTFLKRRNKPVALPKVPKFENKPVGEPKSDNIPAELLDLLPDTPDPKLKKLILEKYNSEGLEYVRSNIIYSLERATDNPAGYLRNALTHDWAKEARQARDEAREADIRALKAIEKAEADKQETLQRHDEGAERLQDITCIVESMPDDKIMELRTGCLDQANSFTRKRLEKLSLAELKSNPIFLSYVESA